MPLEGLRLKRGWGHFWHSIYNNGLLRRTVKPYQFLKIVCSERTIFKTYKFLKIVFRRTVFKNFFSLTCVGAVHLEIYLTCRQIFSWCLFFAACYLVGRDDVVKIVRAKVGENDHLAT